ncbi:MAG: type II toxin-antitoxin system Phd/YefM family antitoxin [Pirellulales bacterium]
MATDNQPGNVFGAYEAKVHFSELLQQVEQGHEITITRHGTPVARMIPAQRLHTSQERQAAIERLAQLRRGLRLGKLKVKNLITEGRR